MLEEVEISSGLVRIGTLRTLRLNMTEMREPDVEISSKEQRE